MARLLAVLPLVASVIIATVVGAAVLLGIGTLLAKVFAVSVWEATIVATVVGLGLSWLAAALLLHLPPTPEEIVETLFEDAVSAAGLVETAWGLPRGRKKRRR